jgi:alpha-amylase
MKAVCLYFQVHQPFRLKTYRFFDIGNDHEYYDEKSNKAIMQKVAKKCYLPATELLYKLIRLHKGKFKISFSISGTALDQFELYAPEVLNNFKKLAATGAVEFIAETNLHSLSSIKSPEEFKSQALRHAQRIHSLFGQRPKTFRNTELIYSNKIARMVADMGFEVMLTEGAGSMLGWRSPHYLYNSSAAPDLKLLLRNYRLSDDLSFRFSQQSWREWPITADKYISWLEAIPNNQKIINLFMDFETFGEHQWRETGIFDFLEDLPGKMLSTSHYKFVTPSEAAREMKPIAPLSAPKPISWADEARDLSAWLGNDLQKEAFNNLYRLEKKIRKCEDPFIIRDWEYLQNSDHFYYMCTKSMADGEVHDYFTPYESPFEAFVNYMNVLKDFELRVNKHIKKEVLHLVEDFKRRGMQKSTLKVSGIRKVG